MQPLIRTFIKIVSHTKSTIVKISRVLHFGRPCIDARPYECTISLTAVRQNKLRRISEYRWKFFWHAYLAHLCDSCLRRHLFYIPTVAAVQHERGPRNSTIRRQTANYHKKMNDVELPVCSSVSPYWSLSCTAATPTDVATLPFNATLLRHPVPHVINKYSILYVSYLSYST